MTVFAYQARDEVGRTRRGKMDAPTSEVLVQRLRNSGFWVTEIREVATASLLSRFLSSRVKMQDMAMYLVQLASLLEAGVPLPQSLQVLVQQTAHPRLGEATQAVLWDVQSGKTFSAALEKHPKLFSPLFVHMVEAGEASGNLNEVLLRLAGFVERDADIRGRVKGAMTYPMILTVLGTFVVIYMIAFVVPNFVEIFQDSGVPLPLPTQVLYMIGRYFRFLIIPILLVMVGSFVGVRWFYSTKQGHFLIDRLLLKVPVVGGLIEKVTIARFTRTLGTLIGSGVPLLQSLEITQKTLSHAVYEGAVHQVALAAARGEPLSKQLRSEGVFPPMVVQMVAVGEETGNLDRMLYKISDFYEKVSDQTIKNLTAVVEPIFLVVIGSIIGFIFAAIMLPMFQMVKTLDKG